jgi:hypothetical protein
MAGFSTLYVIGGQGGFIGADGVNPIEMMIMVGEGSRQWLEAHYLDKSLKPIGSVRRIVPEGPDHPNALLDACIAFCPHHFRNCPSYPAVEAALKGAEFLDFDANPKGIPAAWPSLREEARPVFKKIGIWRADLVPLNDSLPAQANET